MGAWFPVLAQKISNTKVDVSGTVAACSGELVDYTGTVHMIFRDNLDAAGGEHAELEVQMDTSGVGETSGARYVGHADSRIQVNASQNGTTTTDIVERFTLIGQGNVPNSVAQFLIHVTVTPEGTIIPSVSKMQGGCP
jgi:hypothetical protein